MATLPEISVFIFCMLGCGFTSWYVGREQGIVAAVDFLADKGIIQLDEVEEE